MPVVLGVSGRHWRQQPFCGCRTGCFGVDVTSGLQASTWRATLLRAGRWVAGKHGRGAYRQRNAAPYSPGRYAFGRLSATRVEA